MAVKGGDRAPRQNGRVPRAITYAVTDPALPGFGPGALAKVRRGLAYELDGAFVHFFGQDHGLWTVSPGLTVTQSSTGDLERWAVDVFGAEQIRPLTIDAGHVVDGVWRPGLYYVDQIWQALGTDAQEQRAAEQSLHLLVSALNDLFLYVEPEHSGLDAYGPKTRELLILACTEVEDVWNRYLRRTSRSAPARGYVTNDYVALRDPLHLAEYQLELVPFANVPKVRPFAAWRAEAPTRSLAWYDAYNKTKHDRSAHLSSATVAQCIEAVAANVVLYCVRFGPFPLFEQTTPLASLATHLFSVELVGADPTSFYVPLIDLPARPETLGWGDSRDMTAPWTVDPLTV